MTDAAVETRQTQGAVSQQVKRLECLLGQKLFVRSGKGLILTASGAQLIPEVKDIITACDAVLDRFQPATDHAVIRFGMPYDLVATYLSRTLDQFSMEFPDIEVELHCNASPILKDMVDRGELDLMMIEEPIETAQGSVLRVDPLVWIGKAGGKAYSRRPLPISLVAETCVFRSAITEVLDAKKIAWRTVFQNGNFEATMATVRSDLSITAGLKSLVPSGMEIVADRSGLPNLPSFAISLYPADRTLKSLARELSMTIQRTFAT